VNDQRNNGGSKEFSALFVYGTYQFILFLQVTDFDNWLKRWSFEATGVFALDTRLGKLALV